MEGKRMNANTMPIIKRTDEIMTRLHKKQDGSYETCFAYAEEIMLASKLNFDDIERINELNGIQSHEYTWGSDKDRKYRKSAIRKAISFVSADPLRYMTE